MQDFWKSDIGAITGNNEEAFAKTFRLIPDGTLAIGKIAAFTNSNNFGKPCLNIRWEIVDGEFKGSSVFQKIFVFDDDQKKRHRALNMFALLYKLFAITIKGGSPSDDDLKLFLGKHAGIKIQETEPNDEGKQYNWVSEVHPATGFSCVTGVSVAPDVRLDSAFKRNEKTTKIEDDSDIPF